MAATILIIEDHTSVRTLLAQVLQVAGYWSARLLRADRDSNGSTSSPWISSLRIWRCQR